MKIEKEIADLAKQYHTLIAGEHHKDRDCHWYVETIWSYGESPKYMVRHKGYIYHRVEAVCATYQNALRLLRDELASAVNQEKLLREKPGFEL